MAVDDVRLVFACGNRGLLVYSINDKSQAIFKEKLDDDCKFMDQSEDGKMLAYASRKVHLSCPAFWISR